MATVDGWEMLEKLSAGHLMSAAELERLERANAHAERQTVAGLQAKLEALYGSVNDIDAFVGGLAEDKLDGSMLGELLHTAVVEQFARLRDGDAYWYENRLTDEEIAEINATTLSALWSRFFFKTVAEVVALKRK